MAFRASPQSLLYQSLGNNAAHEPKYLVEVVTRTFGGCSCSTVVSSSREPESVPDGQLLINHPSSVSLVVSQP